MALVFGGGTGGDSRLTLTGAIERQERATVAIGEYIVSGRERLSSNSIPLFVVFCASLQTI
jgi:hypothetical protein